MRRSRRTWLKLVTATILVCLGVLASAACGLAEIGEEPYEPIATSVPGLPDMEVTLSSTHYGEGKVYADRPFVYLLRVRNVGDAVGTAKVKLEIGDDWNELDRSSGGFECLGQFEIECRGDIAPGTAAWMTITGHFTEEKRRDFWARAELVGEDGNPYNNRSVDSPYE